jgi:predicted RNA binding protein YcfA (HicA-like mRNA interferase family)
MAGALPAITGPQLIRLLELDGWTAGRRGTHGAFLSKRDSSGVLRHTIIPTKTDPLARGTLHAILGAQQTGLGRAGLLHLIQVHGLR